MKETKTITRQVCLRCGYEWWPRKTEHPRLCPNCHSAYWDIPRQKEMQGEKAEG